MSTTFNKPIQIYAVHILKVQIYNILPHWDMSILRVDCPSSLSNTLSGVRRAGPLWSCVACALVATATHL